MQDDSWFEQARREAGPCPFCGADAARPILYGMPLEEDDTRLQGRVVFAGCMIPPDPPAFSCGRCRFSWGRRLDGFPDH